MAKPVYPLNATSGTASNSADLGAIVGILVIGLGVCVIICSFVAALLHTA